MEIKDEPAISIPYPIKLGRRHRFGVDSISRRYPTTIRLHELDHQALNQVAQSVGLTAAELVRWSVMHVVSEIKFRETGQHIEMEL